MSLITVTAGSAQEAKLSGLVVTCNQDEVVVFTTLKNAFNPKMQTTVTNGFPVSFVFLFTLSGSRKMWFDKAVAERKETHTMTYDPLKEKYSVTRSWESDQPFITASFEEACNRMCRIEGLKLARTKKLQKGTAYFVHAKVELDKMTLPLYLHYVLFFVSFWDVETDWKTVCFTH